MKKFILVIIILILPYIIIQLFNKEPKEELPELDYKLISNRKVRVLRNETKKIDSVPLEEYVLGVLAGEMPISFEIEALKAQAVAARSYVLKRMDYNKDKEYDVIDTVQNQVYLDKNYLKNAWKENYKDNINKLKKAINDTQGEYVSYDGKIADTLFFSTSNGYTENSEDVFSSAIPYLISVSSTWDEKTSPVFNDKKELNINNFCKKLNINCNNGLKIDITNRTKTGRVKELTINNQTYSSSYLYSLLQLRSTDFTIEQTDSSIIFHTKGFGHGVGMSQYGALGMAKEGYNYKEILEHYYTGTTIKKL